MTVETLFDQTHQRLRDWVAGIFPGIAPSSLAPSAESADVDDAQRPERGVSVYLLELIPAPPGGSARRLPLQLCLRYLVTAWANTLDEANRMLGQLAFAAMENNAFDLDLEPLPVAAWVAFGVRPQPSFAIRVMLRLDRPSLTDAVVRQPIVVHSSPVTSLEGVVLTPQGMPVAGARVELPDLHLTQTTNNKGRFRLSSVPSQPRPKLLAVRVKGKDMIVSIPDDQPASAREPLVIRFDLT